MGYRFACDHVVPGCAGEVEGETIEEVLGQVADHAQREHGITEITDELVERVKAGIEAD